MHVDHDLAKVDHLMLELRLPALPETAAAPRSMRPAKQGML